MSKHKYTLLVVTGFAALTMIGANVTMGNWSFANFNWNLATVGQSGLSNTAKPPFPVVALERSSRGEEAIARLGDKFPEIAQWYKVSEEELKETLRKDKNLWVDKSGRLYYQDTETVTSLNTVTAGGISQATLGVAPLDQTFTLHSRPGAPKTTYLDFNGHYLQAGKSAWVSTDFNAPPFDTDGNPSVFGDGERQTIQSIWLRISEDYAPFNVDITTEEPTADKIERSSSSDTIYGNRILFTPASYPLGWGGSGGVAYLGAFDDIGEYYKTALVFPESLANSDKYMAEAGSHENGHSLGLNHDGVTGVTEYYFGQGDWAPIMGVGYYRNIVQWSKGDYANPSNTQDDLQTMVSYGLAYNTDDYGNSISSAGNLNVSGNTISGGGLIEKNTDVDYFKFNSGPGQVTIDIGVGYGANLDVLATLYNSSGNVIATNDPYGLASSISATVPGGSYYLSIRGTGAGDPNVDGYSSYGSLGQYSITGTIVGTSENPPVAQISASPTSGSVPLTVLFSSNGSSDPDGGVLSYSWDFGDGTSSSEPNPQKTYSVTGTYSATLTVQDQTGLSGAKSITISTLNQAPVAFFTVSTASYNIPSTINLDASGSSDSDGTISSYSWNFGDGTTGTGISTSHVYSSPGSFPITLTVRDNGGLTSTKTVSITTVDPLAINAPSNLSATAGGRTKGQVSLKWVDNSGNETHFFIERALRQGTPVYQKIAEVGANVTTYNDTIGSGTYYYRVKAYNGSLGKSSAYSNAVQVRVK